MQTCERIFRFLAGVTDDNFAWDMDVGAVAGILDYSSRALAAHLDGPPDGLGLLNDLTSLSERLETLKEAADADH